MSRENVEVVLASIEAFNAGDVDAQMATCLPTAVAITHAREEARFPGVDVRMEGRAAIRGWVTKTLEVWRTLRAHRVSRIKHYQTTADALKAVGLAE